jgi:hypothetical protein
LWSVYLSDETLQRFVAGNLIVNRTGIASAPLTSRAALTNDPLRRRADGRTPQGRRIRDLFRAYSNAMGTPSDPGTQAAILAAAELVVAAECARAKVLADGGDVEQPVRLENLAARATRRFARSIVSMALAIFSKHLSALPLALK